MFFLIFGVLYSPSYKENFLDESSLELGKISRNFEA